VQVGSCHISFGFQGVDARPIVVQHLVTVEARLLIFTVAGRLHGNADHTQAQRSHGRWRQGRRHSVGTDGETHVQRQIHVRVKNVNGVQSAVLRARRVGRDHNLQLRSISSSRHCHRRRCRAVGSDDACDAITIVQLQCRQCQRGCSCVSLRTSMPSSSISTWPVSALKRPQSFW